MPVTLTIMYTAECNHHMGPLFDGMNHSCLEASSESATMWQHAFSYLGFMYKPYFPNPANVNAVYFGPVLYTVCLVGCECHGSIVVSYTNDALRNPVLHDSNFRQGPCFP